MQSKQNQIYNMNEYGSATLKYIVVFIYNINNNKNNQTYPSGLPVLVCGDIVLHKSGTGYPEVLWKVIKVTLYSLWFIHYPFLI